MKIALREITVRDLVAGCQGDGDGGGASERTCACQPPKIHFKQAKGYS